jgi:hypothetical protein
MFLTINHTYCILLFILNITIIYGKNAYFSSIHNTDFVPFTTNDIIKIKTYIPNEILQYINSNVEKNLKHIFVKMISMNSYWLFSIVILSIGISIKFVQIMKKIIINTIKFVINTSFVLITSVCITISILNLISKSPQLTIESQ